METQQGISAARLQQKIGLELAVLIDSVDDGTAIGRSYADAPEIDGTVVIENAAELKVGEIAFAEITAADDYDLYGSLSDS
jgi:ribosomal protein S12 methylthiotransferase